VERLDELIQEPLNTVITLKSLGAQGAEDPAQLQKEVQKTIDKMMRVGPTLGIAHADVQDMAYAIVALVDEIALKGSTELSEYWVENLLQMYYFDENLAGEGFYDRLEDARAEQRYEVTRVYYLCLLMGFLGRYAMRGGDIEVQDLISSIRQDLGRDGLQEDEPLSPNGDRPDEPLTRKPKTYRFFFIPIGAVGLAVGLYVVLAISISNQASGLIEFIEKLIK